VLASAEKLNSASAFAIGDLSLASTLVVETQPDEALRQALSQQGVTVI
jgi:DeoR/GlpR family transcriptional regulator of sugar metabolism